MSTGLSTAFVQLFHQEVKQAYQATAQLQGVCRMRTGVEGNTVNLKCISGAILSLRKFMCPSNLNSFWC